MNSPIILKELSDIELMAFRSETEADIERLQNNLRMAVMEQNARISRFYEQKQANDTEEQKTKQKTENKPK